MVIVLMRIGQMAVLYWAAPPEYAAKMISGNIEPSMLTGSILPGATAWSTRREDAVELEEHDAAALILWILDDEPAVRYRTTLWTEPGGNQAHDPGSHQACKT